MSVCARAQGKELVALLLIHGKAEVGTGLRHEGSFHLWRGKKGKVGMLIVQLLAHRYRQPVQSVFHLGHGHSLCGQPFVIKEETRLAYASARAVHIQSALSAVVQGRGLRKCHQSTCVQICLHSVFPAQGQPFQASAWGCLKEVRIGIPPVFRTHLERWLVALSLHHFHAQRVCALASGSHALSAKERSLFGLATQHHTHHTFGRHAYAGNGIRAYQN